jgi:hypothetical protein|tara:strand:- start:1244 stop:2698 length:1455 start_codon:yes stop_codon:yes gene_type:complete
MLLDDIYDYISDNEWLIGLIITVFAIIFLVLPIIIIFLKITNSIFPYVGIREIKRWSTSVILPYFLCILFIVGFSISPVIGQIQSNDWVTTDAIVDFAEERQETNCDAEGNCSTTYWTHVEYIYEFDNNTYSGNRYTFLSNMNSGHANEYPTGMTISVFVDPDEPNESLMVKGWSGVWIEVLAFLSIFALLVILLSASIIIFKIAYLLQSSAKKQQAINARTNWTLFNHFKEWYELVPSIHNGMLNFSFLAFNRAPRIWVIVGPTIFLIFTIVNVAYISDSLLILFSAFTCLILPLFALLTAKSFEKTLPEHSHKRYKLVYDAARMDGQGGWDSDPEAMELQAMARSAWIKKNSNSLDLDEALMTSAVLDSQTQLDGGSRILNVQFDGQDGTIEVTSMNDILNNLDEIEEIAIIYLEESKEMGRHLEFRSDDSGDDWYFHVREFLGKELILQESINMDHNHLDMIEIISNALESLVTEDDEWWT